MESSRLNRDQLQLVDYVENLNLEEKSDSTKEPAATKPAAHRLPPELRILIWKSCPPRFLEFPRPKHSVTGPVTFQVNIESRESSINQYERIDLKSWDGACFTYMIDFEKDIFYLNDRDKSDAIHDFARGFLFNGPNEEPKRRFFDRKKIVEKVQRVAIYTPSITSLQAVQVPLGHWSRPTPNSWSSSRYFLTVLAMEYTSLKELIIILDREKNAEFDDLLETWEDDEEGRDNVLIKHILDDLEEFKSGEPTYDRSVNQGILELMKGLKVSFRRQKGWKERREATSGSTLARGHQKLL